MSPTEPSVQPMTHEQATSTHAHERYLLDEMTELERFAFEEHYFSCFDCAEAVRAGEQIQAAAAAGVADARGKPLPFQRRSPQQAARWTVAVPWAAAASLALAVGYQQFAVPRRSIEPQALAPVTLRAASRGADPVVRVGAGGVATFAVDINSANSGTDLAYALRNSDGEQVASGRVPAPPAGTPLLLLVPASSLRSDGRYVLIVRDATNADSTATEYAFVVTTS
jgi:hypothetical protein